MYDEHIKSRLIKVSIYGRTSSMPVTGLFVVVVVAAGMSERLVSCFDTYYIHFLHL